MMDACDGLRPVIIGEGQRAFRYCDAGRKPAGVRF